MNCLNIAQMLANRSTELAMYIHRTNGLTRIHRSRALSPERSAGKLTNGLCDTDTQITDRYMCTVIRLRMIRIDYGILRIWYGVDVIQIRQPQSHTHRHSHTFLPFRHCGEKSHAWFKVQGSCHSYPITCRLHSNICIFAFLSHNQVMPKSTLFRPFAAFLS